MERPDFRPIRKERLDALLSRDWERPAIGLMLRYAWRQRVHELASPDGPLTWLEIFPENYFRRGGARWQGLVELAEYFPITSHGVHLSIGGDSVDSDYVEQLSDFLEAFECPWASDHMGVSMHGGELLHEILPVVRNERFVELIVERLRKLRDELPCDFCLENAAYYMTPPGCTLTERQFLSRLVETADLQLVFDVNNLWVNACNHGYDPEEFVATLPRDCVREIHMGGFSVDRSSGLLIDSHDSLPSPPVWDLLEIALRRFGPVPVLLEVERDDVSMQGLRRALERIAAVFAELAAEEREKKNDV